MIYASPPGSAVFHAVEKGWGTTDYLLAELIDGIAVGNWQRTGDAQQKNPQHFPKPFPRPVEPKAPEPKTRSGKKVVPLGIGEATVTTVGEFMKMRKEREARWREKHPNGRQQEA